MIIHTRNEHLDMQANKLNAKYHLHVQHSTDITTQGNCIKDIKSNKGIRVMQLKKCITFNNKYQATKHGYKTQSTEYKITLSKTLNIGLFYLLLFNINTPPLIKLFLPLSLYSPYHHLPLFVMEQLVLIFFQLSLNLVQLGLERGEFCITMDGVMVQERGKSGHLSAYVMDGCHTVV